MATCSPPSPQTQTGTPKAAYKMGIDAQAARTTTCTNTRYYLVITKQEATENLRANWQATRTKTHWLIQGRWKAWEHTPHTTGQSSPGNLASGEQESNTFRQIPHTSSPAFHVQDATALHSLISTSKVMSLYCCCSAKCVILPCQFLINWI